MSRFMSAQYDALTPYVPGEQPRDMQYIKLNTNESPFPPPPSVIAAATTEAGRLQLYSDPECTDLIEAAAAHFGVKKSQIVMTNGSDEVLNFAFMAFADEERPLAFPDITYGFYPVFADLNRIPYEEIPLKDDFSIDPADYIGRKRTVVIANPNAPTGRWLTPAAIETIVRANRDAVVIIDEAYVDFGAESVVPLVDRYDNLLVTQTFSKSRSMAGARLGFGIGSEALIADLNTIRFSTNPYNINRMTGAAGVAALRESAYYRSCCSTIAETRAYTTEALRARGFEVLDSRANFVFARLPGMDGGALYRALKMRGVLVRHFDRARIADYNRITIGTRAQMDALLEAIDGIRAGK